MLFGQCLTLTQVLRLFFFFLDEDVALFPLRWLVLWGGLLRTLRQMGNSLQMGLMGNPGHQRFQVMPLYLPTALMWKCGGFALCALLCPSVFLLCDFIYLFLFSRVENSCLCTCRFQPSPQISYVLAHNQLTVITCECHNASCITASWLDEYRRTLRPVWGQWSNLISPSTHHHRLIVQAYISVT